MLEKPQNEETVAAQTIEQPHSLESHEHPSRVFIAEDDPKTSKILIQIVEKGGIHPDSASTVEGALRFVEEHGSEVTIALLDGCLEHDTIDTLPIAQMLREKNPDVTIIGISGQVENNDLLATGSHDFKLLKGSADIVPTVLKLVRQAAEENKKAA